ncbi:hypothetical protein ID866_13069 [Astraeus odoratus]|nr:hypothetical protein ID866_13069 [Astraeus odoratus]
MLASQPSSTQQPGWENSPHADTTTSIQLKTSHQLESGQKLIAMASRRPYSPCHAPKSQPLEKRSNG